jgi:hypothetical protein
MTKKGIWIKHKNIDSSYEEDYIYVKYNKNDTAVRVRIVKYDMDEYYSVFYSAFSKDEVKLNNNAYKYRFVEHFSKSSIHATYDEAIKMYNLDNEEYNIINSILDLYD